MGGGTRGTIGTGIGSSAAVRMPPLLGPSMQVTVELRGILLPKSWIQKFCRPPTHASRTLGMCARCWSAPQRESWASRRWLGDTPQAATRWTVYCTPAALAIAGHLAEELCDAYDRAGAGQTSASVSLVPLRATATGKGDAGFAAEAAKAGSLVGTTASVGSGSPGRSGWRRRLHSGRHRDSGSMGTSQPRRHWGGSLSGQTRPRRLSR